MSTTIMHHLQRISLGMTLAGALLITIALLANLGAMWLLGGMLLVWAGIVKIVVTLIWRHVAHLGSDDHQPTPGT
jgi:hypothetical protein